MKNYNWILMLVYMLSLIFVLAVNVIVKEIPEFTELAFLYIIVWAFMLMLNSLTLINYLNMNQYFTFGMKWLFFPVFFVVFIIYGVYIRKSLKYLKSYWFLVSLNQLYRFLYQIPYTL